MGLHKKCSKLCNYVIGSASLDIFNNTNISDRQIVEDYENDLEMNEAATLRFSGDFENKYLMPLSQDKKLRDVPMFVWALIPILESRVSVPLVAGTDVGLVVNLLKKCFPEYSDNLQFSYERDNDINLPCAIQNGIETASKYFEMSKMDFFYFMTLDMPFFYNIDPLLHDNSINKTSFLLNLSAEETVFGGDKPGIFRRKYDGIFIDKNKKRFNVAKPNILGLRVNSNLENLMEMIFEKFVLDQDFEFSSDNTTYFNNEAIIIKAKHKDPFRLRNINSWDDLIYYNQIIETIKEESHDEHYHGLDKIYPYVDKIVQFNEAMKDIVHEIPILSDFSHYANNRIKELGQIVEDSSIPKSFDSWLISGSHNSDDIPGSIDMLEKSCHRFNKKKEDCKCMQPINYSI